jgi:hypothetical protein
MSGIEGVAVIDRNTATEGRNQSVFATFTDVAGNRVTATVDGINIDTTPPSLVFDAPNPAPNAAGWNNSDVRIGFTVRDDLSGGVSTSVASPLMLTTEGSNVSADVVVTDAAGNSATFRSPAVRIDKTLPVAKASVSPAANANGWNNTNVTVSFSGTDALSGIAACTNVVLTTDSANQTASGTCTDNAGNVSLPATVSGINIDTMPPTLVFDPPNPAPNAAHWNNTDVRMGFTTRDNLSGVVSTSVVSPLLLTTEGANVTRDIVVTDAAGNSATIPSPAVKIDKTRPTARASASPAPDADGWNHSDVTVSFSGTDTLSGIAACVPNVLLTTNGANQSASGTCLDSAGNVSMPATVSGININKTGPAITGMPAANCTIWPPDKRLVQIADIRASGSLSIKVTSNEPVNAGDIVVSGGVVQVRADRLGNGNTKGNALARTGRVYTVVAKATDPAGSTAEATGSCVVPHSMSN